MTRWMLYFEQTMLMKTDTRSPAYGEHLKKHQTAAWKSLLQVQAPYRWNIRRLITGDVLDVGCGIGRNLSHLGGRGVGVDHSEYCVAQARLAGLEAFSPEDFFAWVVSQHAMFDHLLLAHVIEHMKIDEAKSLIEQYGKFLKPGGTLILITPQSAGYASDSTHVTYFDFVNIARLLDTSQYRHETEYSFPFPKVFGRWFLYNEFVSVWKKSS
jgi:2-polyprenyl-3-methyl-5-hydroxy-6-metoxy-1,4-benzoquinol methylase